jgi:hypothetical protein
LGGQVLCGSGSNEVEFEFFRFWYIAL